MQEEKLWIIAYDISNPKRWKKVFTILKGYGEWLQLSIFQCSMSDIKAQNLITALDEIIDKKEDHILLISLGKISRLERKISSLGKPFKPIEKKAFIF